MTLVLRLGIAGSFAASAVTPLRASAEAPPASIDLVWDAPAGCSSRELVIDEIGRLLGASGAKSRAARRSVRATARVDGAAAGLRLRVTTESGGVTREREIAGKTCVELGQAAALIVALASAADDDADPTQTAGVATAIPTPPTAPKPASPLARRDRPAPVSSTVRRDVGLFFAADAALDVAALPHPAPGVAVAGGVSIGPARLEGYALYFPPARATIPGRGAGADVSLFTGDLRLTYAPIRGSFELRGAIAFEAGAFVAQGFGVSSPETATSPWLAPALGVGVAYLPTRGLALIAGVDGLILLARQSFDLTAVGEAFRPPPATARASVGLELRLP